jgi:YD repeat-containing protein
MLRTAALLTLVMSVVMATSAGAASFGRTPGHFGVSASGSAQYTIPFPLPRGVGGVQPSLALQYDSQAGNDVVGPGWMLTGLGGISRCKKTSAQDTVAAPVALSVADGYCLNGNRLRLTSGTYGVAGSTYQTEIADFSNITAYGAAGNGPQYFIAQTKSGLYYEYGNGSNSSVFASGSPTPYQWLVSKVRDRSGNNYVVTYGTGHTGSAGIGVPLTLSYSPLYLGSTAYTYVITFVYGARAANDTVVAYNAGYSTMNTNQLLSFSLQSGTTTVKTFVLTYELSPTTSRNRLKTLQECASTDCLVATTFTYQNGGVGTTATATPSGGSGTALYDIDGDGRTDLTYYSSGAWYVRLSNGSGYGAAIATGVTDARAAFGDLLGKGITGILANNGGTFWYYTLSAGAFVGQTTNLAYDATAAQYVLADLDGNGHPALVALYRSSITSRTNTSSATTPSFAAATTVYAVPLTNSGAALMANSGLQAGKLQKINFNGDGRQDLLLQTDQSVTVGAMDHDVYTNYELVSNGSSSAFSSVSLPSGQDAFNVFFLNWNDDACTDAVFNRVVYISGCNGTLPVTFVAPTAVIGAMDWNGDGRTDLLVANGSTIGVYLSTDSGMSGLVTTSVPYSATAFYCSFDIDGDGLDDLGYSNGALSYYLHNGAGLSPDLVTTFSDGYGNSASPTYASIVQSNYLPDQYSNPTYPYANYLVPLYVVNKATFSDPTNAPNGTYYQTFLYSAAWVNLQGRGFSNFSMVQTFDSRSALYKNVFYGVVFPYTGIVLGDGLGQAAWPPWPNQLVKQWNCTAFLITLDATENNQRYFPTCSATNLTLYELGGSENLDLISTTATSYTYDNYGNATNVSTTVADNDPGSLYPNEQWTSTTVNTIAPSTATWCLDLPTQTTVTRSSITPSRAAITRTVSYPSPDYTNCRQNQQVVEPSSATYKVTTDYLYDTSSGNFGNLVKQTVTGIGMTPRVTQYGWTTNGQFLLTVTNPLSQTTTLGFDPNSGMLTSVKDPNNLTTSWQYDSYARKITETRPDSTSTTWTYNDCATAGCVNSNNRMTIVQQLHPTTAAAILRTDNTYLDALDRPLVTSQQLLNASYNRTEVQYDNLGNAHLQGMPCNFTGCTQYWTTNTYDVLNRLTKSQRPISAGNGALQTTNYTYQGRTTTVTELA